MDTARSAEAARRTTWCLVVLAPLLAGCALGAGSPEARSGATVTRSPEVIEVTEVTEYRPAPASARIVRSGYCTGPSKVLDGRRDAWRCIDDERIADPCFETPGVITCGVNPIQRDIGYQLQLTEPLPERTDEEDSESGRFWLVELADGTLCGVAVGGTETIEGEPVTYRCGGGAVLLGAIASGDPFTARQMGREELHGAVTRLEHVREVAVRRAWR